MTQSTTSACPKCRAPIATGARFCASCGNDISGVWGPGSASDPALGSTIAVEMDPNVDVLGQMLGEATIGDYDIYGELGRGGMAAVYLGLDLALNRKVAIKTMLPELIAREGMVSRFKREAQTSAALSHPHIIQIYTVKQSDKLVYFVMKFIEGRSLESVITDKGQVPLEMAQVILSQVGSALAYAHRKGVVHRDIKPANIMIDEDGWAIVTDFGIAKVQEAQNLTATGTAIGTPHYMSPEQFHNKSITGASDQYSLGVVAYEMLTGRKPFDGGTYAEIITQHLFEPPPDLRAVRPDAPEHVVDVIRRMMAKDPSERFPDCEAAAHALGHPPTKQGGDVVRTQMISLAKSGPQKKIRMSVPMSPIPVTRKAAPAAATVAEPRGKGKPLPKPLAQTQVEEKSGGGAGKWIGIAAVVLGLAGGGTYYYMNFLKPKAAETQPLAAAPAAQDSSASAAVAPVPVDSAAIAQARSDSIIRATALEAIAIREAADSVARAREATRLAAARSAEQRRQQAAASTTPPVTRGETTPVQQQAARAPEPQPVARFGTVRLGSRTPNAVLYIDGVAEAAISTVRFIRIPAARPVHLSVQAEGCSRWDTTLTVIPDSTTTIGMRTRTCP
ncbi:MAG: protein kinase [Gemmatimonadaceae bacterium]